MLRDTDSHDFWKFERFPHGTLLAQQFDNHIGLCRPCALPTWPESQLFLSRGCGVVVPESVCSHRDSPRSSCDAILENEAAKSRKPETKNRSLSWLCLSGATLLAESSCRPARVSSVTARKTRRLAIRHEMGSTCFIVLDLSAPGWSRGLIFASTL